MIIEKTVPSCYSVLYLQTGMEFGGGIKNLKIGVGEVIDKSRGLPSIRLQDVSVIRNIQYFDKEMVVRKAR